MKTLIGGAALILALAYVVQVVFTYRGGQLEQQQVENCEASATRSLPNNAIMPQNWTYQLGSDYTINFQHCMNINGYQ